MSEYSIEYGAKRPLKFRAYGIDSQMKEDFLDLVIDFVGANVNIKTAQAMDVPHYCQLIEKISILVCKAESPTANYGITKPEIRSAVKYAISYWSEEAKQTEVTE